MELTPKKIASFAMTGLAIIFSILELVYCCILKDYYGGTSVKAMNIVYAVIMLLISSTFLTILILEQFYNCSKLVGVIDLAVAFNLFMHIIIYAIQLNYNDSNTYNIAYIIVDLIWIILLVAAGIAFMIGKIMPFVTVVHAMLFGCFAINYIQRILIMLVSSGSNKFLSYFNGSTFALIVSVLLLITQTKCKTNEDAE